jgi:hypothetical protein
MHDVVQVESLDEAYSLCVFSGGHVFVLSFNSLFLYTVLALTNLTVRMMLCRLSSEADTVCVIAGGPRVCSCFVALHYRNSNFLALACFLHCSYLTVCMMLCRSSP